MQRERDRSSTRFTAYKIRADGDRWVGGIRKGGKAKGMGKLLGLAAYEIRGKVGK